MKTTLITRLQDNSEFEFLSELGDWFHDPELLALATTGDNQC